MLNKLGGIWVYILVFIVQAPRPSTGPHKLRECLPLSIMLRERLKYALTRHEAQLICIEKDIKVDGKVRTDINYPAGFMDVIEIPKSKDIFRLLYDVKGRFVLHKISQKEAEYKLCRVQKVFLTPKKIPVLTTSDGRTIRYPDPAIKVNDTIKVDIATGKITGHIKFDVGKTVMVTKGRNAGRVGIVTHRDRHFGSFDIVHIKDEAGNVFATRLNHIFVIGDDKPLISLPKGKGIKISIMDELRNREAKNRKQH